MSRMGSMTVDDAFRDRGEGPGPPCGRTARGTLAGKDGSIAPLCAYGPGLRRSLSVRQEGRVWPRRRIGAADVSRIPAEIRSPP